MGEVGRPAKVALLLALAAAFSSWNPVAAPFGLAVGIAAAVASARAARASAGRGRRVASAALVLSALAAAASAAVLLAAAGVGRGGEAGPSLPPPRSPGEVRQILDRAEAASAEARARARRELEDVEGAPGGRGAGEEPPARR
ncbi:MAG TPA: hypothetical protein VLS93_15545 [Anaeromyxobacteraceae bacterium]|nr:hypothetical protein [Anaeromyxobacteraceae bacterium]